MSKNSDLARKLREALFDHIESESREALQDGAIDRLFEQVLAKHDAPSAGLPYVWAVEPFASLAPHAMSVYGLSIQDEINKRLNQLRNPIQEDGA